MIVDFICTHWKGLLFLYILQGVLGVLLFEHYWKKIARLQQIPDDICDLWKDSIRPDRKTLRRSMFYPGCFLWLVPSLILQLSGLYFMVLVMWLTQLGRNHRDPLEEGWRKTINYKVTKWTNKYALLGLWGFRVHIKEFAKDEVDYSKYLGPNWKEMKLPGQKVSTIVANHTSMVDICAHICHEPMTTFVAGAFAHEMPIAGFACQQRQVVSISRDGDDCVRISQRQEEVRKQEKPWDSLTVFVEGQFNNGKTLTSFRKGGFAGLPDFQPRITKFQPSRVSTEQITIHSIPTMFMWVSQPELKTIDLSVYPDFIPNEYLYTEYAKTIEGHEKMEKWEVLAHAARDLLCTLGDFEKSEQTFSEKKKLIDFLNFKTDTLEYKGKSFTAPSARSGKKAALQKKQA